MKRQENTFNKKTASDKEILWVITELYYPENNQTGYYLTKIGEGLADEYDVRVICGQPNYAARGIRAAKRETHENVEIFRVWGTTLDKDVLFFRLINMLTLGVSMFFKTLVKIKKRQKVLVVSAPPTLPFPTAIAAKIKRSRYVLIVQDKYPETLIAVGKAAPDALWIKFLNRANRWLYDGAYKIIVVGRDMAKLVASQMTAASVEKIKTIQNWASLEEVEPDARADNRLLAELGLQKKFVFLYAGNMGHPQDIESIVAAAADLKTDERFHFLFLGSGVKRKWLEREVAEKNLQNVTVLAPRPRSEQKLFLNACDVGLVPLIKGMRGVAMPSRTYNLMAAGKPILALTEEDSEVARVIEEDAVGWFVAPGDSKKLVETIKKIYRNKSELAAIGRRSRAQALEKYSVETAISKYKAALREK